MSRMNIFMWYWVVGMLLTFVILKGVRKRESPEVKSVAEKLEYLERFFGGATGVFIITFLGLIMVPVTIKGFIASLINGKEG